MNENFVMEQFRDAKQHWYESKKSSGSAALWMIIGLLALVGSAMSCAFFSLGIDYNNPDPEYISTLGCCASIMMIFAGLGVMLGLVGIVKKYNANREIKAAENDMKELRRALYHG